MNYLNKKTVEDIDVAGKKVLVRCDFNVPFDGEGNISDPKRIDEAMKTIKYLVDHNAKVIADGNDFIAFLDGKKGAEVLTVEGDEMVWTMDSQSARISYTLDGDTLTLIEPNYPDQPLILTRSDGYVEADYTVADVAGTWVSYDNSYLGDSAEGYIPIDLYWVFNEDGTVSYYGIDSNGEEHDVMSGTYTVSGNELTITTSAGEPTMLVIRIDGDTMTMGGLGPADTYMTLTRQA